MTTETATEPKPQQAGTSDPDAPPAREERRERDGDGGGGGGGDRRRKHANNNNKSNQNTSKKPGYFQKDLEAAEELRRAAEERAERARARREERARKTADRDRLRRAVAKAKRPGRNGKAKLGRESNVLLEKVKRMMG
ncbi:hypothetical protein GGTG_02963 [Gaeumannomyces tritici R3-111a-1]|uniref:rRNA-processing protein FYV7 n=1 Tax=Gaeumannomyces tritici (strain R3-111a-1) TaxID=644352 RepID=J3NNV7_GAET3|nr:hypothetical protein GGTG_02963 [Gaeumannomyces tritici R3-111a-1]EJT77860.1 hypothetical protein GGTG_02963 [Gaeumannomyces tritici R3-111a-1]